MPRSSPAVLLACLVVSAEACAAPTAYTLEPNYTQGVFQWDHLGFSTPTAQFSQGTGTLDFDAGDVTRSSVQVTIPIASVHTGVAALDEHLASEDFFEIDMYPTATFTSRSIERATGANRLVVHGELTLHGITRPVALDVTILKIGVNPRSSLATIGIDAVTVLRRSEFGLGKYIPQVGDEVQVHLISQAVEAKTYAAHLKAEAEREAAAAHSVPKQ